MSDTDTVMSDVEVAERIESSKEMGMRVSALDGSTLMISSPSTIATIKWRAEWDNAITQFSVRKASVTKDGATRDRYLVVAGPESGADSDPAETFTRYPESAKVIAGFDKEFFAYALIFDISREIERSEKRLGSDLDGGKSSTFSCMARKAADVAIAFGWGAVGIVVACVVVFGATVAKHYGDLYAEETHESLSANLHSPHVVGTEAVPDSAAVHVGVDEKGRTAACINGFAYEVPVPGSGQQHLVARFQDARSDGVLVPQLKCRQ